MADIIGSRDELTAQGVIEVVVTDLARAIAFYRGIGFTVTRETTGFAVLRWNEMLFFLAEDQGASSEPRWANLRIVVPDIDEIWERLHNSDAVVVRPVGDRPYGLRDFTIRDPFGFELRFAQVIA